MSVFIARETVGCTERVIILNSVKKDNLEESSIDDLRNIDGQRIVSES